MSIFFSGTLAKDAIEIRIPFNPRGNFVELLHLLLIYSQLLELVQNGLNLLFLMKVMKAIRCLNSMVSSVCVAIFEYSTSYKKFQFAKQGMIVNENFFIKKTMQWIDFKIFSCFIILSMSKFFFEKFTRI